MRFAASRIVTGLRPGVLAALLAGWLLAPSAARATCGDYVVVGGQHGRMEDSASHRPVDRTASMPAEDSHRPCSGPRCSRGPVPLPLTPLTLPPLTTDLWGCLPPCFRPSEPDLGARLRHAPSLVPVPRASSVYHPPRLPLTSV